MDLQLILNTLKIVIIFISFPEHTLLLSFFVLITIAYSVWMKK